MSSSTTGRPAGGAGFQDSPRRPALYQKKRKNTSSRSRLSITPGRLLQESMVPEHSGAIPLTQRLCENSRNTTHGSGWMVQGQPTQGTARDSPFFPLPLAARGQRDITKVAGRSLYRL